MNIHARWKRPEPAYARKGTALLILIAIAIASLWSAASIPPSAPVQATATLSPDEILLTPPLARTPLPTDMPGGGNGWMAASLMFFLCMVGMLVGGIMIAFVVLRLRQRRERS